MKRVGIFGGTFDPVHHGHLILGREAIEALRLNQLIFIPAAMSPHKADLEAAAPDVRLEMLRAAIQGETGFQCDDLELQRPPPSYAVDTAELLRFRHPTAEFFFLVGQDHIARLPTWHRFDELSGMVQFVVLDRSGVTTEHPYPTIRRHLDISATTIRNRVATGQSIRYLVHAGGRKDYPRPPALQGASKITAENLAKTCAELAADKKAEEIVVLDLQGISTFTDFFVICSGTSEPHLKAIAGEVEGRLKQEHGLRAESIDGFPASQWIVLDYMRVIVHVFHREKREFYSLEDLWSDAPRLTWPPADDKR